MNKPPLSSVVRIQKARTTLLLDHPFFGTLLFRLGAQARSSIATMATDGVSLYFNLQFVETLSAAEIAGTLAHEVMHPALQHHTRRGDRNPRRWNMACDYAINPMLLDAGLTLPKDVLLDNRFRGMSAERIYNLLEEEEQNQSSSSNAESESQGDAADSGGGSKSSESKSSEETMDEPRAPQTPGSILAGQQPRLVHLLYFDTQVQKVETYQAGQPVKLAPVGGGGTDFRPCFHWLERHGITPQTLVFLTDLCGSFPSTIPAYPVLWATTEVHQAPFGEVIPMDCA